MKNTWKNMKNNVKKHEQKTWKTREWKHETKHELGSPRTLKRPWIKHEKNMKTEHEKNVKQNMKKNMKRVQQSRLANVKKTWMKTWALRNRDLETWKKRGRQWSRRDRTGLSSRTEGRPRGSCRCGHFGARMAQDSGALPDTVSTLGNVFWYVCRGV